MGMSERRRRSAAECQALNDVAKDGGPGVIPSPDPLRAWRRLLGVGRGGLGIQTKFNILACPRAMLQLVRAFDVTKLIPFPNSQPQTPSPPIPRMPDAAQINRSLSSIRTELEFLQASNVLSPPQFQSIMAQLPVRPSLFQPPNTQG